LSAAVIGVNASTSAAITPATGPAQVRTARYSTRTAMTPPITCGSTRAQLWKPKTRTNSACTWNASGILSIEIDAAGSNPPYRNAFQLLAMLYTAAP
jgi:hypothetical protein